LVPPPHKSSESEERISAGLRSGASVAEDPPAGLIARISRWWRGPSPVRVPSNPPESLSPEKPPGLARAAEPAARPIVSDPVPKVTSTTGPAADRVNMALRLDRALADLEAARHDLAQERERSQARIRDVEAERDQLRADSERARYGRSEVEGHTNMLRKSVTALERQLQEDRDTAAKNAEEAEARIHALEEALQNARAPASHLRGEMEDNRAQRDRLESLADRFKSELETAQRQLQEEREAAGSKIQQLESELARKSGATDTALAERTRIEERAALVQKALEVMEQQLREEREASSAQIRQLEAERDQNRAKLTQLETRAGSLIAELDRSKGRSRKKAAEPETEPEESILLTTRAEARIEKLENELATTGPLGLAEKQTATTRISHLESRWEDLKARLLPKDREISELRQLTDQLRAEVQQLQAALAEARQQPAAAASVGGAEPAGSSSRLALTPDAVETLYHQAMSKLTVLMASADIMMMNPRMEPGARETAQEIKAQAQSLLDLIKSYTLPPEAQKSH